MIVQRRATHTLPQSDARAGGDLLLWRVVRDLLAQVGDVQAAGLRVTLETGVRVPTQIDRPEVGIDWGSGSRSVYRCMCGWTTEDVEQLVKHLTDHGARAVTVTPDTWGGLKGRRRASDDRDQLHDGDV